MSSGTDDRLGEGEREGEEGEREERRGRRERERRERERHNRKRERERASLIDISIECQYAILVSKSWVAGCVTLAQSIYYTLYSIILVSDFDSSLQATAELALATPPSENLCLDHKLLHTQFLHCSRAC